jgi:hypothetical protein
MTKFHTKRINLTTGPGLSRHTSIRRGLAKFDGVGGPVYLDGILVHPAYADMCRKENHQLVEDPENRPAVPSSGGQQYVTLPKLK